MGNQGMTNWKLTTLFAVSLILIAGLFSNAAIAAEGDGDGTITVGWGPGGDSPNLPVNSIDASDPTPPLTAGAVERGLKFTYVTTKNMAEGAVEIRLNGWAMGKIADDADDKDSRGKFKFVTVSATVRRGSPVSIYTTTASVLTEPEDPVKTSLGSVTTFTADKIVVKLGTHWSNGGTLTITLGDVTVPIPGRLYYYEGDTYPYTSYEFLTKSNAKDGAPTVLTSIGDEGAPVDAQPRVRVGSIEAGKGTATVNKGAVYQGDTETFEVTFTAAGPMYDDRVGRDDGTATDHNAGIRITVPTNLRTIVRDHDGMDDTPDQPVLLTEDDFSFSDTGSIRPDGVPAYASGVITIDVDRMDEEDTITVEFMATVNAPPGNDNNFIVSTRTRSRDDFVLLSEIKDEEGVVITALSYTKDSSGRMVISPNPVEAGSKHTFELTYIAAAALGDEDNNVGNDALNVQLRILIPSGITLPDNFDPDSTAFVTGPSKGSIISELNDDTSVPAYARRIAWDITHLAREESFTTTIKDLTVPEEAGTYPWTTAVSVGSVLSSWSVETAVTDTDTAGTTPNLFVYQKPDVTDDEGDDAVIFEIDGDTTFTAGSKQDSIKFKFTADDTPIKGGAVWVDVPYTWTRPVGDTDGDNDGEVTAQLMQDLDDVNDTIDVDVEGEIVDVSKDDISAGYNTLVEVSDLRAGGTVVITYSRVEVQESAEDGVRIYGHFNPSSTFNRVLAGIEEVDVVNAEDGTGTAEITSSDTVTAGSAGNKIVIQYKAVGTMDGGAVSLRIPSGWGLLQRDPEKPNYIDVKIGSRSLGEDDIAVAPTVISVTLDEFDHNDTLEFVYGGGTPGSDIGAKVQDEIGTVAFTIYSKGNSNGRFEAVEGIPRAGTIEDDLLGTVYLADDEAETSDGQLRIKVRSGDDGTGNAKFAISRSQSGSQTYVMADGTEGSDVRVHAGDTETYLTFTYTADQPISKGQLRFFVPIEEGWSSPQGNNRMPGYTRFTGNVGEPTFNTASGYVTIDITSIARNGTISIRYGGTGSAGATAPKRAMDGSLFRIEIKGSDADTSILSPINSVSVKVWPQASGGGTAEIVNRDLLDLGAGDMGKELMITYKAVGEIMDGAVRLTLPAGWSKAMGVHFDGLPPSTTYGADLLTDAARKEAGLTDMQVLVEDVNLMVDETLTFTYTNVKVQPTKQAGVQFGVAVDGGAGPGKGVKDIVDMTNLTVDVGQAIAGSGDGDVDPEFVTAVAADATAVDPVTLTFTYTAVGQIEYPRIFAITIDDAWPEPTTTADSQGSYTVEHVLADGSAGSAHERLNQIGRMMRARVKNGAIVAGGDKIIFKYTSKAPADTGPTSFEMRFDDEVLEGGDLMVNVESASGPSMVVVNAPGELTREDGPVMVTIMLRAEDGTAAMAPEDTEVTLDPGTGMFSMTDDGDAILKVDILRGQSEVTVFYSNEVLGKGTIMVSAGEFTPDDADIETNPKTTEVTLTGVDPDIAKLDTEVTVTARGTEKQAAVLYVGAEGVVINGTDMDEGPDGTYTHTFTVNDTYSEAMHDVWVVLNEGEDNESESTTGALTIDKTPPMITDPSRGDETHVMAGDTVEISAMVSDASTVTVSADVSGLNAAESPLSLMDADGDGMYSDSVMVTAADPAADGEVTITITASDAAGNEAVAATVMVTLDNTVPVITEQSIDMPSVMVGGMATISATLSEASTVTVSADVSMLNAAEPTLSLMDADGDGEGMVYTGSVYDHRGG